MNYWVQEVEKFSKIIIYGAGNYGKKVFAELKKRGYSDKIECFCVTQCTEVTNIENYPICSFDDLVIDDNALIIVSLGSINHNEVVRKLKSKGIKNWIDGRGIIYKTFDIDQAQMVKKEQLINDYLDQEMNYNGKYNIRASHVTYAYVRNAGDTFLSHCIRQYLDFKSYNIIPVSETVTEETIESINNTDVLFIGGGGLFLPDTNKNELSGWQWAISKEMLSKIQVPIIVYTVGYNFYRGQIQNPLFRDSVNALVKKASFVGLRNSGSINEIKKIVDADIRHKIVLQPCITTITSSFRETNTEKGTGVVALNMGFDRLNHRFPKETERIKVFENVAKAIKTIEELGYHIKYYSHNDVDEEYIYYLKKYNINFDNRNLSGFLPQQIWDAYEDVEVVIGMRGHSQMIPFGMGRRMITLSSHDKMKWFLDDIDLLECYVDLNAVDDITNRIVKVFEDVIHNKTIQTKIENAKERFTNISEENKKNIIKIITDFKQNRLG